MTADEPGKGPEQRSAPQRSLQDHLELVERVVSKWPRWKQTILGGRQQELAAPKPAPPKRSLG